MTNKLVVANFKMSMDTSDVNNYLKDIATLDNKNVVICPTSIYLPYFLKKKFEVGLQNVYKEDLGAYTGEISPKQAYSIGVRYVILGHSERRQYFKETNVFVNEKIKACLKNNLKVILCIGETKEERDLLKTKRILKKQIVSCLKDLKSIQNVVIAYEPIWSIGTNITPTNAEIEDAITFIKDVVWELFEAKIKVLYGGSVNENNIKSLNSINNVDGFLVGGASTNYSKFKKIIKEVTE